MARRATQGSLEEYAAVLRGLGLSTAEIRSFHDRPEGTPLNLETLAGTAVDDATGTGRRCGRARTALRAASNGRRTPTALAAVKRTAGVVRVFSRRRG